MLFRCCILNGGYLWLVSDVMYLWVSVVWFISMGCYFAKFGGVFIVCVFIVMIIFGVVICNIGMFIGVFIVVGCVVLIVVIEFLLILAMCCRRSVLWVWSSFVGIRYVDRVSLVDWF